MVIMFIMGIIICPAGGSAGMAVGRTAVPASGW
jgi:hypothetical protein